MSVNSISALLNRFRTVMVNVRPHKGIQRPLVMVYCNSACHGELVSGLGEYLTPIDSPVIQNAYRCPKRYCNALEDGIMMLVIDDKVPDGEVLAGVRGDVGLREVQVFGDGGDAEALLVEEAEDAETRFFAERFQGADASEAIHGGTG